MKLNTEVEGQLTGEIAIIHNAGDNWYLQAGSKPGEYTICIGPAEED